MEKEHCLKVGKEELFGYGKRALPEGREKKNCLEMEKEHCLKVGKEVNVGRKC